MKRLENELQQLIEVSALKSKSDGTAERSFVAAEQNEGAENRDAAKLAGESVG